MTRTFDLTFDYLCPFASNANQAVVEGLRSGADWDVTFRPFSLAQTKVEDGDRDVWEKELSDEGTWGVLALLWGIAVRDNWPDRFLDFHVGVFEARHGKGVDIGDPAELATIATTVGLDPDAIAAAVASGSPSQILKGEHTELVDETAVFGVPTFIVDQEAVFVRSMDRPDPDEVNKIVDLISWTNLNEFKRTKIPR